MPGIVKGLSLLEIETSMSMLEAISNIVEIWQLPMTSHSYEYGVIDVTTTTIPQTSR